MGDHAKNRGLGERTPPRLIEAHSASKSDSVSNVSTESEDTFPGFENAVIIDQRDVGVAEEAISSHLIAPGSDSDSDADADSDAGADTVPGSEKKVIIDRRDLGTAEEATPSLVYDGAKGRGNESSSIHSINLDPVFLGGMNRPPSEEATPSPVYDGAKGRGNESSSIHSINLDPVFLGGMNRPPSEDGVDSQGPGCFETKVQFERADGDTLSWAAVVKKD